MMVAGSVQPNALDGCRYLLSQVRAWVSRRSDRAGKVQALRFQLLQARGEACRIEEEVAVRVPRGGAAQHGGQSVPLRQLQGAQAGEG